MCHSHYIEARDGTLKAFMRNTHPFDGMKILIAGDVRSFFPVDPSGPSDLIVNACVKLFFLYVNFQIFRLTENMRLRTFLQALAASHEAIQFS